VLEAGTSRITVQSFTYSDFRQLFAREAATVTVRANLGFPEEAKDRYPAVVVVDTIGGYREASEGYAAAELRKSGFAALTYDSFAARETTGSAMSRSETGTGSAVADAYAALRRRERKGMDANSVVVDERLVHDIGRLDRALWRAESGRDVLGASDFHHDDLKTRRADGRPRRLRIVVLFSWSISPGVRPCEDART
jgi:hypothetical protein